MDSTQILQQIVADIKSLHRDVRKIRQKLDDPSGEKAKARSENNGFKKPIEIDDALRSFLSLNPGDLISRSEVTRAINKYAEAQNLKSGQVIRMDKTLGDLLNPPAGEEVTFLKLQTYLSPHYVKPVKAVADDKPAKPKVVKKKV
jgi:chromatin remodeling complex protein RSC6